MSLLHRETGTTSQHLLQRVAVGQPPHTLGAHAAWYRSIEPIHHRGQPWLQPIAVKVTADQKPYAARDIEADTAGGDDPVIVDVGRRHATDRESVSPVHVGHRIRRADNPRQRCHIDYL